MERTKHLSYRKLLKKLDERFVDRELSASAQVLFQPATKKNLWKTGRIKEQIFWYGMGKDITEYVVSCNVCNKNKKSSIKGRLPMHE